MHDKLQALTLCTKTPTNPVWSICNLTVEPILQYDKHISVHITTPEIKCINKQKDCWELLTQP